MVHRAGAVLAGGHTVTDDEVKYGLAVTGRADPRHLLTNAGARAGDLLVLTKPLGTGILSTAGKQDKLAPPEYQLMVETMRTLNAVASRAALAVGVRCATDVTGFGLLGHASHIARASNVTLRIDVARVPVLPGAREAWLAGSRTGGEMRNAEYLASRVRWGALDDATRAILVDPQTSGGLLVAVRADAAQDYLTRVAGAVSIGSVGVREDVDILLS